MSLYVTLTLLFLVCGGACTEYRQQSFSAIPVRKRVATAIHAAVQYMRNNYMLLNLDALTGLRIVQAQLAQLHPTDDAAEVRQLLSLVRETAELALPEIESYDTIYYNKLKRLADADFWSAVIEKDEERIREKEAEFISAVLDLMGAAHSGYHKSGVELFDEDSSDRCIQQVLDTRCNVSKSCLEMMTAADVLGYTATHQLYYFLILSQSSCLPHAAQHGVINDIKQDICSKVYMEMKNEPTKSDIQQDLFMEQVGLCGLAGYFYQFSRSDWVERILSWQRPSGCYGQADDFLKELMILDEKQRFKREVHSRVKREERIMSEGCLCHRTTVAVIALVQNYRSLVEPSKL